MAKSRETKQAQPKKLNKSAAEHQFADLRQSGKIVARVIDVQSELKVVTGIYAIRMYDEGVRHLFLDDYIPTIGKVVGDVTLLTADGEVAYTGIYGFYKLQHNMFTLLIEGCKQEE